ncbi:unnamed protein product [Sphagnum balticum]
MAEVGFVLFGRITDIHQRYGKEEEEPSLPVSSLKHDAAAAAAARNTAPRTETAAERNNKRRGRGAVLKSTARSTLAATVANNRRNSSPKKAVQDLDRRRIQKQTSVVHSQSPQRAWNGDETENGNRTPPPSFRPLP